MTRLWLARPAPFDSVLAPRHGLPGDVTGIGHILSTSREDAEARGGGPFAAAYDMPEAARVLDLDGPEAANWPLETLLARDVGLVRSVVGWRTARAIEAGAWLLCEDPDKVRLLALSWRAGRIGAEDRWAHEAEDAHNLFLATAQALAFKPMVAALRASLGGLDAVAWRRAGSGGADVFMVMPRAPMEPAEVCFPGPAPSPR